MADLKQFVQDARDAGYSGAEIQWHLMKNLGYPPSLAIQATREKMGPPEAPRTIGMPSDTSFSQSMSQVPDQTPGWIQALRDEYNKRFTTTPVMGGPVGSLADITPVIPQSKTEAALLAAGALIPPGKALAGAKAAVNAGTRMLEGAAPEVGALSRGMALAGEVEPWQIPKSQLVPYSETVPRPKAPHDETGGYSEAEINARALRNRAAETEPPDITRHPVGSWGIDPTGELMQLREYSLDDPKLIFTESHGKNPTVRKYMEWIKEGNEPPPLRGLETEKGSVRIQQGNHRAIAIRETGGDKAKVWTVITRNRPIGGGQVMGEGLTHEGAIRNALAEGKAIPPEVLADYPDLAKTPQR